MIGRARQIQYLRAMGIDVWVPRSRVDAAARAGTSAEPPATSDSPSGAAAGFTLGPGSGSLLLLCDSAQQASLPIAADIARCLDGAPVWGWPARDAGGVPLEAAVRERLFTGVLVFGTLAEAGAAGALLQVCASARIVRTQSLPDLARDPDERRALWSTLSATGWVAPRRQQASGRR